jgi:hypothetical protein
MSGTNTTVAATPSAVTSATGLLTQMAALSGQATDFNAGSQIRTLAEATGSALEQQGIGAQALAVQALFYGALSLFGIASPQPTFATGNVIFATALPLSAAPNLSQSVYIPSGTLVATAGGVQFSTTVSGVIPSGTTYTTIGAICTTSGPSGNVAASGITGAPLTAIGWPLVVTNPLAMAGGAAAGTQSSALALFTSLVASLGRCTPVSVANSVIGVSVSGTGETVAFASNYEPWLTATGALSGQAGFTLFIDNGTGSASANLIAATIAFLNGSVSQNQVGNRPNGVPFTVSGVTPVYASVSVTGTVIPGTLPVSYVSGAITSGITNYFNTLGFAPAAAQQGQIAAVAGDAGLGTFESLGVNLYYSSGGGAVSVVSGSVGTRVILESLGVNVSVGS